MADGCVVWCNMSDIHQWRVFQYRRWGWYIWRTRVDTRHPTCCNC